MRIKNMATIREVLYQHTKKNSSRSIARAFNISNTTVKGSVASVASELLWEYSDIKKVSNAISYFA